MSLVNAKCPNCNEDITVDDLNDAAICHRCGLPFVVEKAIALYSVASVGMPDVIHEFEITSGVLTAYNGLSAMPIIPDNVQIIGARAFENKPITDITFPSGVTEIRERAFLGCNKLERICLPDRLVLLGNNAFKDCKSLRNITIPFGVHTVQRFAFDDCSSLTSLTVSEGVEVIEPFAFDSCEKLSDIRLPNSLRIIGNHAFSGCKGLCSITIPAFVTDIGDGAFHDCENLTCFSLKNPAANIADDAIEGCNMLITTDVCPYCNGSIGLFHKCKSCGRVCKT